MKVMYKGGPKVLVKPSGGKLTLEDGVNEMSSDDWKWLKDHHVGQALMKMDCLSPMESEKAKKKVSKKASGKKASKKASGK